MTYTELNAAAVGSNASTITSYTVDAKALDSSKGQKEYKWVNARASEYLGYYKTIPELKMSIDAKATWTIGKGFTSPSYLTTLCLSTIRGTGKDTFNSILENVIRNYHIYGDAFAEIIREGDKLVNLKVLDPAIITTVSDEKGLIIRYEQNINGTVHEFEPSRIFHLARNRIGDEVHGVSIIDACEWIILARNEAMADYKKLLHRNVYPVRIWHLDTDVPSKIAIFKAKVAASKGQGEDIFIPKGSVETELATVSPNSTLDPRAWINELNQYFFQAVSVPQIIIGGSQELTQTAAQIAYLAFEQVIEEEQLFIEEQVLNQLNLEIELTFPASLQNNLLSDLEKDGTTGQQMNQPSNFAPPMMRTGVVE